MKRYTLRVTITEGSDKWWEDVHDRTKTLGIEEVVDLVKATLEAEELNVDVEISQFFLSIGE